MLLPRVVAVALAVRSAAAVEVEVGADGALHDVAARALKDAAYPMDAASRRFGAQLLASRLNASDLDGDFDRVVRPALLGACGLRDERRARPGKGNTGHCFADWNHVDCCTMALETADSENRGKVAGIAASNFLGDGIRAASVEALGDGGSWCTCTMGSAKSPPGDVCHVQFNARPAFKVVWAGRRAACRPDQRRANAREFAGSKYAFPCRPRASASSGAI
ncbi:hypothetical protein JL721_6696 [Aureococcus anophagefferens]|nr:hypothetical protein JL721_6696 [Aureococcus anophagefferens]